MKISPKFKLGDLVYYWDTENNCVSCSRIWSYTVTRYQTLYSLLATDNMLWNGNSLFLNPKDVKPVDGISVIFQHIMLY